eukprot:236660_1
MSHLDFGRSSHCNKWIFSDYEIFKREEFYCSKWNISISEFNELFCYLTEFQFIICHLFGYDYHCASKASILFRRIYQLNINNDLYNDDPRLICIICIFISA